VRIAGVSLAHSVRIAAAAGATPPLLAVQGQRVLAYENRGTEVHFFLDDAVYADMARALLPEIAGYAAACLIISCVRAWR